jgi:hypothetical protein
LQRDIARTVACGLRLDDEGFHPTVLVYGGHRHPVGGGDPPGAAAGPGRVWVELSAHDDDRPGKPNCAWNDPQATKALGLGLVNDALAVLAAVADLELDAEQDDAVALLALVAGQDVEPDQRPGTTPTIGPGNPRGTDGCRRVPYRGIGRNGLWWSLRVAAVNLRRLLVSGLARQDGAWGLA